MEISYGGKINPECICDLPSLEKKRLQARSQIIGWYLLLISIIVALAINTTVRCFDRFTIRQNYYYNAYREVEETKFEEIAKAKATALATENWNNFFNKKNRTKLDWDHISVVPLSDFPHFLKKKILKQNPDPYFSPLHRWANSKCLCPTPPPPDTVEPKGHGKPTFVSIDETQMAPPPHPGEVNKEMARDSEPLIG